MASAGIPVSKEPQGLSRSDGKRPDSLSLILWQAGKPLTWDVTIVCPLADSYVAAAAREAGSVAELAADRKSAEYTNLDTRYTFQPVAIETLGSTTLLAISCQTWVTRFLFNQAMMERFSDSLCPGGRLTVIPSSLHCVAYFLNPLALLITRVKK